MDWSGVDYLWIIVMFLSAVWTLVLTATHSLQRIHCWASDVMLHFSKSDPSNKLMYILDGLMASKMFIFGWNGHQIVCTHMCGFWKGSPAVFRVILEVGLVGGLAKFNFRALRLPDKGGRYLQVKQHSQEKAISHTNQHTQRAWR